MDRVFKFPALDSPRARAPAFYPNLVKSPEVIPEAILAHWLTIGVIAEADLRFDAAEQAYL